MSKLASDAHMKNTYENAIYHGSAGSENLRALQLYGGKLKKILVGLSKNACGKIRVWSSRTRFLKHQACWLILNLYSSWMPSPP